MEGDEENSISDSKLTWSYLIQGIMDEVWLSKPSLIVVAVITLFPITTLSILPFFESFWDIRYAVGILIFLVFLTIIPVMIFYIMIFLRVRKKLHKYVNNTIVLLYR